VDEPSRLSKRVVALTSCSRSQAQQYIEGGFVLVDGEVVDEPQFMVQPGQAVAMAPDARLEPVEPATFLLHRDAVAEADATPLSSLLEPALRSASDTTGIRPLKRHFLRLAATLPPEPGASGLVVVTQDGRLLRRMQEDGDRIEQEYVVEVTGEIAPYGLDKLKHGGLNFAGRTLPAARVSWQSETKLRFALKGIRPRQLQVMCGQVGLQVVAMKRLRIGRVALGPMAVGEWRYLPADVRF
jgi:23S rRNA pseudouridine2604 synthase